MSAEIVLLAALFLAVPISAKYVTSFQIRSLMDSLQQSEHDIESMHNRLDAIEYERQVVEGALGQVLEQVRWSTTRRDLMAEELIRARRRRTPVAPVPTPEPFEPETPPVWEPESAAAEAA
jgi:hypothetical protein